MLNPNGLALDGDGNLYFASRSSDRIRRVRAADGVIEAVAGSAEGGFGGDNGPAIAAMLDAPSGVAVDGFGSVYVADSFNRRVRRVMDGTISTIARRVPGSGDGGPATQVPLSAPLGLFATAGGELYIADVSDHTVRRVAANGHD